RSRMIDVSEPASSPQRVFQLGMSRCDRRAIKNRPTILYRTTTSPLVVQYLIDWPVRHTSAGHHLIHSATAPGIWLEKGRAGGRAGRPARPLAGSRSTAWSDSRQWGGFLKVIHDGSTAIRRCPFRVVQNSWGENRKPNATISPTRRKLEPVDP